MMGPDVWVCHRSPPRRHNGSGLWYDLILREGHADGEKIIPKIVPS